MSKRLIEAAGRRKTGSRASVRLSFAPISSDGLRGNSGQLAREEESDGNHIEGGMRTALSGLAVFAIVALIGCATAQDLPGNGQGPRPADSADATRGASENASKPHIQIEDRREFVRELARLGVSTSIADRKLIKKLFEWEPNFKADRGRLHASFPQQSESQSNVNLISLWLISGNLESERGGLHVWLHSAAYCIRFEDVTAALGEPHSFSKESANLWGRFKKVTAVYGANYQTSKTVAYSFLFEYQECAQQVFLTKNFK